MTDAPERICANDEKNGRLGWHYGYWLKGPRPADADPDWNGVEYVRADIHAAEVKALETERDGWKAAAKRAARNHLSAEVALDAEREKVARLVEVANGMVEIALAKTQPKGTDE